MRRSGSRTRHANINHDVGGQRKSANLPAITLVARFEIRRPKRWRVDVVQPSGHRHGTIIRSRFYGRFHDFVLPDAGRVHERFVRQIHEVINKQLKIAFDVIRASFEHPFRVRAPRQIRDVIFVGVFRRTYPDPDEPMPLSHGIRADCRLAMDPLLAGHPNAGAALIKFQSVVLADQVVSP